MSFRHFPSLRIVLSLLLVGAVLLIAAALRRTVAPPRSAVPTVEQMPTTQWMRGEDRSIEPNRTKESNESSPPPQVEKSGKGRPASPKLSPGSKNSVPSLSESAKVPAHPSSPARATMLEQRARFQRVDDALRRGDVTRARELLEEHELKYPADDRWTDRAAGYEVVLMCRTEPGGEAERAAKEFMTAFPASPLRRQVRKACLAE